MCQTWCRRMATVRNSTPSLRVRSVTVLGSPHSALMGTYTENKNTPYNQQFSSVFTTEELSKTPDLGINTIPSASVIRVTEKGVLKFLSNVNLNKATGQPPRWNLYQISERDGSCSYTSTNQNLPGIYRPSPNTRGLEDGQRITYIQEGRQEQACKLWSFVLYLYVL